MNAISKKYFGLLAIFFFVVLSASTQDTVEAQGVDHQTEVEIANNKRISELLRHPTFITLRVTSHQRDVPREEASTTPSPYTVGDWMDFDFHISQSSSETIILRNWWWAFYECCPELSRDGDVVPYSKEAQEKVHRADSSLPSGSSTAFSLLPNQEYDWVALRLTDWYEPLSPGRYHLVVRKRFVLNGDWAESNQVTFEVMPRRPAAPIPNGLKVRLVPEGSKPRTEGQTYRVGSEVDVDVLLINDSDKPVRVSVIDPYYGHRLQLFKDGKLMPYREETAKLIESKDATPRFVEVVSDFFIDPKTTRPEGVSLKSWYGALAPGLYRLIDRRRFEIDGPWTKDSAALIFEVLP